MYATMRWYRDSPDLADALVEHKDEVSGIIGGIEGFKAYYLVRGEGGSVTSISVFETKAGCEESSVKAAEWLKENVGDVPFNAPSVSVGEVALTF